MIIEQYTDENSKYFQNNPSWHTEDSPWKARQIMKAIRDNRLNPTRIAEVGCGAGEILVSLQKELPEVQEFTGYDISADAMALAMKKASGNLRFVKGDIFEETKSFDLLLIMDVIEHVEDCFSFIRSCKDKAQYKIFHIPLDISLLSVLSNSMMHARKQVGHIHYFTRDTALATLTDCGLEVVDWFYTPSALELPRFSLSTKLANIPRRLLYAINKDLAPKVLGGFSLMVLTK